MSKPKNILVADDSPRDAMLLQTAFEAARLPHRLYHVCYGLQVVSYLNAEPPFSSRDQFPFPHLLILDFQMPRVDAVGVLGFLRQRPEIQMPAVILFGSAPPLDIDLALKLGAAGCFPRPSDLAGLTLLAQRIHDRWLAK